MRPDETLPGPDDGDAVGLLVQRDEKDTFKLLDAADDGDEDEDTQLGSCVELLSDMLNTSDGGSPTSGHGD
jgi:hypothetical protein